MAHDTIRDADLPAHTPGTPKGEEMVRKHGREPGRERPQRRPHGPRCDEHQRRGPRPDRPADAAHAAGVTGDGTCRYRAGDRHELPIARRPRPQPAGRPPPLRRGRAVAGSGASCATPALAAEHAHLRRAGRAGGWSAPARPAPSSSAARAAAKYRRVPRRVRYLADFRLTDAQWEGLHLPINLAFFLHSTPAGRVVALYPSPAGATESLVRAGGVGGAGRGESGPPRARAGRRGAAGEPRRRRRATTTASASTSATSWSGLIRTHWRGLSGGTEVWEEIGRFFAGLKERSQPRRGRHA